MFLHVLQPVEGLTLETENVHQPNDDYRVGKFQGLLDHAVEHNGLNLSAKGDVLGKWLNNQKQAFRQGRLDPWKASLLVELGVQFDVPKGRMADQAKIIKERLLAQAGEGVSKVVVDWDRG